MERDLIYLDTYVLQQDMRIRLPKSVLSNMNVEKGVSLMVEKYNLKTNCSDFLKTLSDKLSEWKEENM